MNTTYKSRLEAAPGMLTYAHVLHSLMFTLPVIILFFQLKGTSIGDFFLIQGLFAIAAFALEIPTGYLGDLFSRKKIIILSYIVFFLGHLVWLMFDGFWAILAGELLFAVNMALYSGTYEAYLYDSLKQQGKEKQIVRLQGKMEAANAYGIAFATITGSFIYNYAGHQVTLCLTMLATAIAIVIACRLPELQGVKREVDENISKWDDIKGIVKFAVNHAELKWLMLYPSIFASGTLILFWSLQPLMKINLIPVALFGLFGFINQISRAVFAQSANYLFRKFKTKDFCLILYITLTVGFLIALNLSTTQNFYIASILIVLLAITASSNLGLNIVSKSMINHRIKSHERATVLSVKSMVSKFFGAAVMISLKFLVDGFNMQTMLIIMAPFVLILTFIAMKHLLKLKL